MSRTTTHRQQATRDPEGTDPARWVDEYGDGLYRYALAQVRDHQLAEDLVQETLLAALQARRRFEGRSSERTWLVSILKHKLIDHFRRSSRERRVDEAALLSPEQEEAFQTTGAWAGHWTRDAAPREWTTDPAATFEQEEFRRVLQRCLAELPPRIARAFWMREVDGLSTGEICKAMDVTATNLWVMLHRARMQLRRSLEVQWFGM